MKSNFSIVVDTEDLIVLEDLGPWHTYQTITNDAEAVVEYLYNSGLASGSKKIVYFDSEYIATELNHDGVGNFIAFGIPSPELLLPK